MGAGREEGGVRIIQKDPGVGGQSSSSSPQTMESFSESNCPDGGVAPGLGRVLQRSGGHMEVIMPHSIYSSLCDVNEAQSITPPE